MVQSSAQARSSALQFTSAVARGLRESAVIALGALALVLFTALATYSPQDPGFSFTGEPAGGVQNAIGPVGAWLADMLFFLFGRPAFLFPLMLAVSCWTMFRHRQQGDDGAADGGREETRAETPGSGPR